MKRTFEEFVADFRRFFARGLAILLPSVVTLWILWTAVTFVFQNVALPINAAIRWAILETAPWVLPNNPAAQPQWYRIQPEDREAFLNTPQGQAFRGLASPAVDRHLRAARFRRFWDERWYLWLTGLIVAVILIYLAGRILGGLLGRRVYARAEALISRIPGFKQVYPHVKQLVDLVVGERPMAFQRVVAVQYPRAGVWTVGLVTSESLRAIGAAAGRPCLTVFIPSTPTPFTGFTISVPADEVIDLPLSIDEAVRFVLTGGALIPEHQLSRSTGAARGGDGSPPLPPPRPEA